MDPGAEALPDLRHHAVRSKTLIFLNINAQIGQKKEDEIMTKRDKIAMLTIGLGILTTGCEDLKVMTIMAIITLSSAVWFYIVDRRTYGR